MNSMVVYLMDSVWNDFFKFDLDVLFENVLLKKCVIETVMMQIHVIEVRNEYKDRE